MPDNTPQGGTATIATEDVGGVHFQKVITANEAHASFRGRAQTFRTAGIGGTVGHRLLTLFNAAGSTVIVSLGNVSIDLFGTAAKAVTVIPPIIRVHRIAAAPTGGTALAKVAKDTALTSNASVGLLQATASDGGAATAITAAIDAGTMLTQEYAPRLITAAGYEMADRIEFFPSTDVILRAGQGVVVNLDYTVAGANPTSDHWIVGCDWYEYV